jgi:GT2 family glycosyltransferase
MRIEDLPPPAFRLVAGCRPGVDPYDVDIIILSRDRLLETNDAIASALSQHGVSLHVTVLDQGSEPETLRAIASTWSNTACFALFASDENLGVAGGRNLTTSLGHGRIIVALDNDAVFENRWVVAGAMRNFLQNPDLGALGFNILGPDGTTPCRFSWGYPARLFPRFKDRFDTTTFVGAGHAIRRTTWAAVGGYDIEFFFTWEEYDFCLGAIAASWRIRYDGSLAVIHKVSQQARVGWDAVRLTYYIRNRLIIARKWNESWLTLSSRVVGYLIRGTMSQRLGATIKGVRAAFSADIKQRRRMSKRMRDYLRTNETRHRGSWFFRIRTEVFGRMSTDS